MRLPFCSTIKSQTGIDTIKAFSGLVTHNKLLATGLLVSMLSALPAFSPLAGFLGSTSLYSVQ
ncbi:MAG: hypothetical protein IPO37_00015 [Saprospiraceae bacterium]|nr:hypothetical protein [Saprospiraceae bacterium]